MRSSHSVFREQWKRQKDVCELKEKETSRTITWNTNKSQAIIKSMLISSPTTLSKSSEWLVIIQWCARKSTFWGKNVLICSIYQFPWCKYSHCGQFQATNALPSGSQTVPEYRTTNPHKPAGASSRMPQASPPPWWKFGYSMFLWLF